MPGQVGRNLTRGKIYATLILLAALAAIAFFTFERRAEIYRIFSSPEIFQTWIKEWGWKAPFVFMLLQFFQVVVFFIPGEIPQIAGGWLFGLGLGIAYSSLGILLGSTFNFYVARISGLPIVERLFGKEKVDRFEDLLSSKRAVGIFFLLFVIPGVPKDFLCYLAGLANFRYPAFMVISFAGRLPGILGSTLIGSAAAEKNWILAGLLLGLSGLAFLVGLIFRDRFQSWLDWIIRRRV